ncbi:MAG TPA: hypothetical protein VHV08_05785, partial [Pirellulales bacterium]|nr:hypothetical protein [Pirellulales bacterium]
MFTKTRLQVVLTLGFGAALGYAAAAGRWNTSPQAQASLASASPSAASTAPAAAAPAPEAPSEQIARLVAAARPNGSACCFNGSKQELLVAQANVELAQAPATRTGAAGGGGGSSPKKPNVMFIMGDDIGWFNIGAYHRGMMSGRTPHLDKLAA